jgi:uncharacterized membrane protein SpoIIM required for sporulation
MNKRQFVKKRAPHWRLFEQQVRTSHRLRSRKLGPQEINDFSRMFRELSHDLAVVRSRKWGKNLDGYLNDLVGRGHNQFYGAPPGGLALFVRYLTVGFPRLFRANVYYFVAAAMLFFVPGAVSWAVIQNNPALAGRVIPREHQEQFDKMYRDKRTGGLNSETDGADGANTKETGNDKTATDDDDEEKGAEDWQDQFSEKRATMAGFYVLNNAGIALDCFARGILLGVGTAYTLLFNGIFIGSVGGYVVSQGHSERFLSFVISHGSFELTAIAIAGGAGLILGDALLHPGQRTRLDALRVRAFDAVQIACGSAAMLIVAALIEAFWSPSGVPPMLKYAVGSLLWVLVFAYLALSGRGEFSGQGKFFRRGRQSGGGE